jgi:gamma-glutamylcysteine synthetase
VDYALDVPMYFVYRNKRYVDCTGMSFRVCSPPPLAIRTLMHAAEVMKYFRFCIETVVNLK